MPAAFQEAWAAVDLALRQRTSAALLAEAALETGLQAPHEHEGSRLAGARLGASVLLVRSTDMAAEVPEAPEEPAKRELLHSDPWGRPIGAALLAAVALVLLQGGPAPMLATPGQPQAAGAACGQGSAELRAAGAWMAWTHQHGDEGFPRLPRSFQGTAPERHRRPPVPSFHTLSSY